MDTYKEIGLPCYHRYIYGNHWLDLGHMASGYQENMDKFDGLG
jgi:hypothetical protein